MQETGSPKDRLDRVKDGAPSEALRSRVDLTEYSTQINELPRTEETLVESVQLAASHLSQTAQRFLSFITSDPGRTRRLDHIAPSEYFAPLQSWPTFLQGEKLAEVRRATVELTRLVKSIPERIFGNDPHKIAAYYGIRNAELVAAVLAPPNGLDGTLVRNDYFDTPNGFKCLEINAGQIGGWQVRDFEQRIRANPLIAQFLQEEGVVPYYRDPLAMLLQYIITHNLEKPVTANGQLNVAIVFNNRFPSSQDAQLNRIYHDLLDESGAGLTGTVVLCRRFSDLCVWQNQVWDLERRPIHAVVQMSREVIPDDVFRCFKAGRVSLYNGPINRIINDKRVLALLSEKEDSDLFTEEERDVLRRYLPWTRSVGPGETTYRGETKALPELLVGHREELVLKPIDGSSGRDVHLGPLTPPDRWARLVESAVRQGGWLAQERIESRPYLYQHGEQGYAVHDVVWGTFCFGDVYSGGFLRMIPRGKGDGVINSARGASEGVLFEV